MYAVVNTRYEVGLREFGEAMLVDALCQASTVFLHMRTLAWEARSLAQSFAFVQGTGLETVIQMFGLSLDAEELRGTFQWKCRRLASASSFAITFRG
jgi:hypothetical protein